MFQLNDYEVFTTDPEDIVIEVLGKETVDNHSKNVRFLLSEAAMKDFEANGSLDKLLLSEGDKSILEEFLTEHPEFITPKKDLIEVDEMPLGMQQLYHSAVLSHSRYDDIMVSINATGIKYHSDIDAINSFLDEHAELNHSIEFDEDEEEYLLYGDFPSNFCETEFPVVNHQFEEPYFNDKFQRVEQVCNKYHEMYPMKRLLDNVWDKYNKKELAPTEETARYFLKVSSALESMQDKGYKTDGFIDRRHNIAKNYFVATKIADQLDKNQVSPDFALEVAKVYSLGRGWEFPRDTAKADMWLRVAAKDKSLESEIKTVKEMIQMIRVATR